jgi:stalled ribosome rescue protein Dom34
MKHEGSKSHAQGSHQQQEKRKKQVGVWLDSHQAFIVSAPSGEFGMADEVDTTAPEHNRTSEHTINQAEKALKMKHYHTVAAQIMGYDHILLFGPGTAQEEMRNLLSEDIHFRDKKVVIDSASQMTQNQMVAKVREFFDAA